MVWAVLGILVLNFGFFLKDPRMVLGGTFPDVSNPNITLYEFWTTHMKFIKNRHVKLDETRLDTQGHFKAHLSNVMDVLGCFIYKLLDT